MNCFSKIIFASLMICLSVPVFAGGPFMIDDANKTGQASHWRQNVVSWKVDDGPLSKTVDHDEAVEWVEELFETWRTATLTDANDVVRRTVKVDVRFRGTVGKNITAENISEYTEGSAIGGETVDVVFDEDGSIMTKLGHDSNSIIGLGAPLELDSTRLYIQTGIVILNGHLIDGEKKSQDNNEVSKRAFKAAILHEIGHVLNLDHCQVNSEYENTCSLKSGCMNPEAICTMFPELKDEMQDTLHWDDVSTVSWLYPSEDFLKYFGTIRGTVLDFEEKGLQGVNVVARTTTTSRRAVDARSMVSGVLYPAGEENGDYILSGCLPGEEYEVFVEPLNPKYKGSSGFEPLDNPPQNFVKAGVEGSDGSFKVICPDPQSGTSTLTMKTIKTSIVSGNLDPRESTIYGTNEPRKRPTMCSLHRENTGRFSSKGGTPLLLFGILLIIMRRILPAPKS